MGPAECFIPHYGVHNDGDVYRNDNIDSFADFVRKNSGQADGLDLVTADGVSFEIDRIGAAFPKNAFVSGLRCYW